MQAPAPPPRYPSLLPHSHRGAAADQLYGRKAGFTPPHRPLLKRGSQPRSPGHPQDRRPWAGNRGCSSSGVRESCSSHGLVPRARQRRRCAWAHKGSVPVRSLEGGPRPGRATASLSSSHTRGTTENPGRPLADTPEGRGTPVLRRDEGLSRRRLRSVVSAVTATFSDIPVTSGRGRGREAERMQEPAVPSGS